MPPVLRRALRTRGASRAAEAASEPWAAVPTGSALKRRRLPPEIPRVGVIAFAMVETVDRG